jgi:hypothetical protein
MPDLKKEVSKGEGPFKQRRYSKEMLHLIKEKAVRRKCSSSGW